jgi:hypothetical protein
MRREHIAHRSMGEKTRRHAAQRQQRARATTGLRFRRTARWLGEALVDRGVVHHVLRHGARRDLQSVLRMALCIVR